MSGTNLTNPLTPTLKQLFDDKQDDLRSKFNCVLIGQVQSFDPLTQRAVIKMNYQRVIRGVAGTNTPLNETAVGVDVTFPYPLLVNVPVLFLFGGSGSLTFPLTAGDDGLLLFCDREIDTWMTSGQALAPQVDRMHDLNDAIFIAGIKCLTKSLLNYNMNGPQLANGLALVAVEDRVKISVDGITLGITMQALLVQLIGLANAVGDSSVAAALAVIQVTLNGILK